MQKEEDYKKLLTILYQVAKANKGETDERALDAEGLLIKLLYHTSSILYLYRSTNLRDVIPGCPISFFDAGSILVLTRAAYETLLVFYYLFIEPKNKDERDLRYDAWILASYLERQKYPATLPQNKKKLEDESKRIPLLKKELEINQEFQKLKPAQRKKLLNKGNWRLKSWREIGQSVGLRNLYTNPSYSYLCDYAHAGSVSILQLRQAKTKKSQNRLCNGALEIMKIVMAKMVNYYCQVFPKSQEFLSQNEEAERIIKEWVEISSLNAH